MFSICDLSPPPFCHIQQLPGLFLVTLALPVLLAQTISQNWFSNVTLLLAPFVILTKNFLHPMLLGSLLCNCLTNYGVLFWFISWLQHYINTANKIFVCSPRKT